MAIDLTGKTFCCIGLRGTGKSTLVNTILEQFGKYGLYYDTLWEAPDDSPYDLYQPSDRRSVAELETIVKKITPINNSVAPYYRLFVIDECNRFCPSKPAMLPPQIADFNDQCRHYGIAGGYVARRPSQLHQDLIELADYIFIFGLTGKNDLKYLSDLVSGLDDAVRSLKKYEFVKVNPDRSFVICDPVKPQQIWLDRADRLIGKTLDN